MARVVSTQNGWALIGFALAVWCVSSCGSERQLAAATSGPAAASLETLAPDQVVAQIRHLAEGNGEPNPTDIQYVITTKAKASTLAYGEPASGSDPDGSVVLAAARGRFRGYHAKGPPGAPDPTGSVITAIIDIASGELTDWSISDHFPNESALGRVLKP
jgi:hypothetical protein